MLFNGYIIKASYRYIEADKLASVKNGYPLQKYNANIRSFTKINEA